MKHVVNDSEVPHLWANQLQSDARNRHGNIYFEGETIYSYGRHFPIARIFKDKKGNETVFFTLDTYSNTTAKHIRSVRDACSHKNVLYMLEPLLLGVSKTNYLHEKNIQFWLDQIENSLNKLVKARIKEIYYSEIERARSEMQKYLDFFGVKLTSAQKKIVNAINDPNVLEQRKVTAKKEKEARDKRLKLAETHFWANIQAWRDGLKREDYPFPVTHEITNLGYKLDKTFLRVNCVNIETSKGIKVPIETAKRYYAFYLRIIKNGGCSGNCNYKMLNYDVSKANESELVVGCHKIDRNEIDAVATKLGW